MKVLKNFFNLFFLFPIITIALFTGCPTKNIDAPTGVDASDGLHTSMVVINWNEVKGDPFNPTDLDADYYKVFRSNETWISLNMFFAISPEVTGTSFIDGNVIQGSMYY